MDGKENLQQEEAPSISVASPRISSVGAPSEDAGRDHSHYGQHAAQGYMESLGHDHLHWGGVGQRLAHDARSVASSAAADRDDKSIYEEPGALDATEGEWLGRGNSGASVWIARPVLTPSPPRLLQRAKSMMFTMRMRSPRKLRCPRLVVGARRRRCKRRQWAGGPACLLAHLPC